MKAPAVILLCFLLSCSEKRQDEAFSNFPITIELVDYDTIYTDKSAPIGRIGNIEAFGNLLILQNISGQNLFTIVETTGKKSISRWGVSGQGPNEYLMVGPGFTIVDSTLIFWDMANREINRVKIADILKMDGSHNVIKEKYPISADFRPRDFIFINGLKISTGSYKSGRFGILDQKNNIIPDVTPAPFSHDKIRGIEAGSLFQIKIKGSTSQSKFVAITLSSDIFEIFRVTSAGIEREYISPFKHIPQTVPRGSRNSIDFNKSIAGIIDLSVTDSLIYLVYQLQKAAEASKNDYLFNEIYVFDWKGNKIKRLKLPLLLSNFCADNHYLYGISESEDVTSVYRFKME